MTLRFGWQVAIKVSAVMSPAVEDHPVLDGPITGESEVSRLIEAVGEPPRR